MPLKMQKLIITGLSLGLLIGLASCSPLSTEESVSTEGLPDSIKEFESHSSVNPEEAVGALREILNSHEDQSSKSDEPQKKDKIEELLNVSELNDAKCSRESWQQFLKILDEYRSLDRNVIPYLLHWQRERALYCAGKESQNRPTPGSGTGAWLGPSTGPDSGSGSGPGFAVDPTDARALRSKLLNNEGQSLDLDTIISILRQLQSTYKNRSDSESIEYGNQVDRLLRLTEPSSDRCTRRNWDDLLDLYEFHVFDTKNVVPYLNFWKGELGKFCAGKGERNWFRSDPYDWRKLDRQIYDSDEVHGVPLGNQKTLELMRELLDLYKDRSDKGSLRRKSRLEALVKVSELSKEKCNHRSHEDIAALITSNDLYTVNILPYLKYWKEEQEMLCHDKTLINLDPERWAELHTELFATGRTSPLGKVKTLEVLKYLHELFKDRSDNGSVRRARRIEKLIKASEISIDKCTERHREEMSELLFYYEFYTVNVVPFLKHWSDEQNKLCRSQ